MSALALDEFTLEMRLHYIETVLASLARFNNYGDFFGDIKAIIDEWISEGRSNELIFFVNLLEVLKAAMASGSLRGQEPSTKVSKLLSDYLNLLKAQEDSQILYESFHGSFLQNLEQNAGLGQDKSWQLGKDKSLQLGKDKSLQLYLQCGLQGVNHTHHFIVPVASVIEIVSSKKVFPLPLAQMGVRGLMSFRSQGIPVIDLSDFGFKLNRDSANEKKCFVVCDYKSSFFALEVDSTDEVLEFSPSQFQCCSESALLSPVVDHFVIKDNESLMVLAIEKLVIYE